ncbi:peptidoglycan editing factor PgeF [Streptomyces sp. 6N223]|uniref:peptidoglycan editing factor PgeF n=1 Tax=Streptomyces sp. 6N223 TaxID=3457412 RepID=UPI003FCFC905
MIDGQETVGGAHFAFTDRWGGVSAAPYDTLNLGGAVGDRPEDVQANRELAATSLGVAAGEVCWLTQVHGREVAVAEGPWPGGDPPAADGVVTAVRGLALAVLTADCTPVLLADPVAGVAGAAHAGRPGLLAGVVPATVEAMRRLGADPARVAARTGPAICGRCYEVPEAMRQEAERAVPGSAATTSRGTPAIDIPRGVGAQLAACGVRDVALSPVCTLESSRHFSYRRRRTTGRQASYVWVAP